MMHGWQSIGEIEENVILFDQSSEPPIKDFNISNFDHNANNIMSNFGIFTMLPHQTLAHYIICIMIKIGYIKIFDSRFRGLIKPDNIFLDLPNRLPPMHHYRT